MKKHFKQITAVLTAILVFVCVLPLAAESKRSAVEIWDGSIAEGFGGGTGRKIFRRSFYILYCFHRRVSNKFF